MMEHKSTGSGRHLQSTTCLQVRDQTEKNTTDSRRTGQSEVSLCCCGHDNVCKCKPSPFYEDHQERVLISQSVHLDAGGPACVDGQPDAQSIE